MTPLFVNDVFKRDGKLYRTLFIGGVHGRLYAIPLDDKNPLPRYWDLETFNSPAFQKTILVVESPTVDRPYTPKASDITVRDLRWGRIEALLETGKCEEVFDKATRNKRLVQHAEEIGTTDRTLIADLRRWWLGGQTQDALLGDHYLSGQIEESMVGALVVHKKNESGRQTVIFAPAKGKARGRRPLDNSYEPLAMPPKLRQTVLGVAKAHYEKDETRSVRATADHVLSELFCFRDEAGKPLRTEDGKRALLKPKGQRPSIDQIRYLLAKALPLAGTYKKRVSDADWKNNHAPASGSVKDDTVGPGDVYEIDATFIDLWIVAAADGVTIIGKATLYLVIDRDTKLIVGFHISLENPSWEEAKQAVLSVAADWKALCKRLGVPYRASDWVALGVLGSRLVGDRAEMYSYASNVLCDGLRISITNPPALASQRKCIVECSFNTTQIPLKDNAPGHEPPKNARKRRGKKYDKDACLTLDQLARIYLLAIIAHNNTVMAGYPSTPEEVYKGWQPTPLLLWSRGIERRMGSPARYPYAFLREQLMRGDPDGVVKVDGIHFKGLVYKFDDPRCDDWLTRASLNKSFKVKVAYSPALVDEVYLYDPNDQRKQYIGKLTSDFKPLAGYSFAEAVAFAKAKGGLRRIGEELNQSLRVALKQDMQAATAPAHAAMKTATRGMQHGSRFRDAPEIRADEARSRRAQGHTLGGQLAQGVAAVTNATAEDAMADGAPEIIVAPNVVSLDAARRGSNKQAVGSSAAPVDAPPATQTPNPTPTVTPKPVSVEPDVMGDILDLIDGV